MIIWLASYPRSGNSWTRQLIESMYPNFICRSVYPERERQGFDWLSDYGPNQVLFLKTHEQAHADTQWPALVIARDGRDALVSRAHYMRDFEANQRGVHDLIDSLIDSPDWSIFYSLWLQRAGIKAVLKYEDMIKGSPAAIKDALTRLKFSIPAATEPAPISFEKLREIDPLANRRGISGAWRDEMTEEQNERFWTNHGEVMTKLGYERDC